MYGIRQRRWLWPFQKQEGLKTFSSSMAKWYTAEVAVKIADEAMQLHGG
jgi:alkylation response protein AidB-like acyl-CoA dehydrogenase